MRNDLRDDPLASSRPLTNANSVVAAGTFDGVCILPLIFPFPSYVVKAAVVEVSPPPACFNTIKVPMGVYMDARPV